MTHKTKGIVLRAIKYGETSLVVNVFTELFGLQAYLVNGVRTSGKGNAKAAMFQPGAVLDMVVYHYEQKDLQRIKECSWAFIYKQALGDVIKNSIVLYMMELLYKCLKQPEENAELFYFCEDILLQLDDASKKISANMALFFSLQLPQFFGFKIHDNYSEERNVLDLLEGNFVDEIPAHQHYALGEAAFLVSQLLKAMHPEDLEQFALQQSTRQQLLLLFEEYYQLHIPEFTKLKTLPILHEVLR